MTADEPPLCAGPDPATRKPNFALPPGATDCHAHIFGPRSRYAYAANRIYTPPDALLADYQRMLGTLGVERAVLVQPSVYGSDNAAMLDALRAAGGRLRAVVVVDDTISDAQLVALHSAGVRGIRFNVVDVATGKGVLPMAPVRRIAERIKRFGWHVQFLLHVDAYPDLERLFDGFPTDIVIDHFGYMQAAKGPEHAGFRSFLRLLRSGRCWVKFTGAYRISTCAMPYPDVLPLARALVDANPERIVWGTDWPHPKHDGPMPNDGEMCDRLAEWIPDAALRRRALVDNPARLYGF